MIATPRPHELIEVHDPGNFVYRSFPGRDLFKWLAPDTLFRTYLGLFALAAVIYLWRVFGRRAQPRWALAAYWAGVGGALLFHLAYLDHFSDDAYIALRYIRHALAGQGLVWNPGEHPVEGFSNLLFTLIGLGMAKLGLPAAESARLLSAAAGLGTLALVERIGRRLTGESRVSELLPLVLVSHPSFAAYCGSGLETSFFGMLVLGCLLAFAEERLRWASLLAGLAWATRPDGALLALALAGAGAVQAVRERRARPLLDLVGPFAIVALSVSAFRLAYFGDLLPNSARAKAVVDRLSVRSGVGYLTRFLLSDFAGLEFLLTLVVLPYVGRRVPRAVWCALTFYVLLSASVVAVGGDWMAGYRYLFPLVILGPVMASVALVAMIRVAPRPRIALAVLLLSLLPSLLHRAPASRSLYAEIRQDEDSLNDLAVHVATLNERGLGNFPVATLAVGLFGYLHHGPILDLCGLNDPGIARESVSFQYPGHSKCKWDYAVARRAPLISFTSGSFAAGPELGPNFSDAGYTPLLLHFHRAHSPGYGVVLASREAFPEVSARLSASRK